MGYTNSNLVVYTKLSPNHSGQRTHTIDRITPHCVVGQCSAEGLGDWFYKSSTKASSNYGIDKDGRVGLYVEEKNRSWCSSSSANDQRAITIECASDTTEPYTFRDVVYQRLIDLCTDICERNGKKKLLWFGDKDKTLNYAPATDEMVLTVHRWFASKSCPGNWMYARMGDLAEKVTARLGGSTDTVPDTPGASDEELIWKRLYAAIKNPYGVAGVMGNFKAESNCRSDNLQQTYEKSLGMTDAQYTAAVDNGSYTNFVHDKAGYGLYQATFWSIKQSLYDYAKSMGKSIGDRDMQVDHFLKMMKEDYKAIWNILTNAKTVREASDAVLLKFERPSDQSDAVQEKRAEYAQEFFDKYAGNTSAPADDKKDDQTQATTYYRVRKSWADKSSQIGAFTVLQNAKNCVDANPGYAVFDDNGNQMYPAVAFTPYTVKVSIPDLNIRKGPSTSYGSHGYTGVGIFTIVDEQDGWGLLKSYADKRNGWISLSYAKKL